jgi:O-antigen/teichoic acid export membrane protein
VVEAIAWFITAPVGQLQHASIALVDGTATHRRVRIWAAGLAVVVTVLLGALALPGVREWILWRGFRLDSALRVPAATALPLAAVYPLLYGHRQYYQGLFVRAGAPWEVGIGAVLRVGVIAVAAVLLLEPFGVHGALLGVGLAVLGLFVEGVYLERRSHSRVFPVLDEPGSSGSNGTG